MPIRLIDKVTCAFCSNVYLNVKSSPFFGVAGDLFLLLH